MSSTSGEHAAFLSGLQGLPTEAIPLLSRYLDRLAHWNTRINLTGATTPEARVRLLIEDVLPAVALLEAGHLVDVGSGNGSPGLVFALLRPDLHVTLLEPRVKRWAFLREVAREVGRPEIRALAARHDDYSGPPGTTVTVRGLALSLEELRPLIAPGGRAILFGRRPFPAPGFVPEPWEADRAQKRIHSFRLCST